MKHRIGIAGRTGFGNPEKCLMDNQWSSNRKLNAVLKKMFKEAIELYFKKNGGLDFQIDIYGDDFNICIGIEPTYMYDRLNVVNINSDKSKSNHRTGVSFGPYGSGVRLATKEYSDYKNNCKFTRFIDKWHPLIREAIK